MRKKIFVTFVTGPRMSGKTYVARMLFEAAKVAEHDQKVVLWFDESHHPTFTMQGAESVRRMPAALNRQLQGKNQAEIFISSGNEADLSNLITNHSFTCDITVRRVTLSKEETW